MRFTLAYAVPLLILSALIPLYGVGYLAGLAPPTTTYHPAIIYFALGVYVVSTLLSFGFSVYNEQESIRRIVRVNRRRRSGLPFGNGSALIIAHWFIKKHTWLFHGTLAFIAIWALVLTNPAGVGSATPSARATLFALLLVMINLDICLVAVGSTIVNRALSALARFGAGIDLNEPLEESVGASE